MLMFSRLSIANTVLKEIIVHKNQFYTPILSNVVNNISGKEQKMFYRKGKTIKLPNKKELSFTYSGDLVYNQLELDTTQAKSGFENSQNLLESSEIIKKIFSLEFGDNKDLKIKRLEEMVSRIKKHNGDENSLEVTIATLTVCIRNQIEHCMSFRKDKRSKSMLIERLHLRSKLLRRLEKIDYQRFTWIQDELQLEYKYLPDKTPILSKREKRIKLAREASEIIRNEKIDLLREKLKKERISFENHKIKEFEIIRSDLEKIGINKSINISEALELANIKIPLPIKEKFIGIKKRKLENKFEKLAHKSVIPDTYIF